MCPPASSTLRAPIEPSPILSLSHRLPPPTFPAHPGCHPPTLLLAQTPARPSRLSSRPGPPSSPSGPLFQVGDLVPPLDRDPSGGLPNPRRAAQARPRQPPAPGADARCSLRPPSRPGLSLLRPSGPASPSSPPRPSPPRAPHSPGRRPRPRSRARVSPPRLLQPPLAPPSRDPAPTQSHSGFYCFVSPSR